MKPKSPFQSAYQKVQSAEPSTEGSRRMAISLTPTAEKLMGKLGPEFQKRARNLMQRIQTLEPGQFDTHVRPLARHEHMAAGLDPAAKNGFLVKDYRTRIIGTRDGDNLTVHYVGTREDGQHTQKRR